MGLIPIQVCSYQNCFQLLRDTMNRYRRVNPSILIFPQVTRISEIRDVLNKECLNISSLNDLFFIYQGTFVYFNQVIEN